MATEATLKSRIAAGVIDCDVHPSLPSIERLYPYVPVYWKTYLQERRIPGFVPNYYPPGSSFSAKPGAAPLITSDETASLRLLQEQVLDPWNVRHAILNCIYGVQLIYNEDLANVMASAVNDWILDQYVGKDDRLKASIVIADHNPASAVKEIERLAGHPGFVQVLLMARSRNLYGKRSYWPIYEAAEAYGLPVCIHAGGSGGNPITAVGWPSYYIEDYMNNASSMQEHIISLVCEGVFSRYPKLRVVLAEGGFSWLPSLMWRFDKNWKGLRRDVPWLDSMPSEIIREHFRLTAQPLDEAANKQHAGEILEQAGAEDMLLFASDYPHWHYDAPEEAVPSGMSDTFARKLFLSNALEIYKKLNL